MCFHMWPKSTFRTKTAIFYSYFLTSASSCTSFVDRANFNFIPSPFSLKYFAKVAKYLIKFTQTNMVLTEQQNNVEPAPVVSCPMIHRCMNFFVFSKLESCYFLDAKNTSPRRPRWIFFIQDLDTILVSSWSVAPHQISLIQYNTFSNVALFRKGHSSILKEV